MGDVTAEKLVQVLAYVDDTVAQQGISKNGRNSIEV